MLQAAGMTAIFAYCFYDSGWACLAYLLVLPVSLKRMRVQLGKKRREVLKVQFQGAVQALAAALAAGYSAENAVKEARRDLQLQELEQSDMVRELAAMERKLDANQTIEEVLQDFAKRSGIEEAQLFAEVFAVGKRSGTDLIALMKDTARTLSETMETEREIQLTLAARKYEQKVMSVMPVAIVLYLRVGCPGFLEPLYHNVAGICVATGALGVYAAAWVLGQKILEIEV